MDDLFDDLDPLTTDKPSNDARISTLIEPFYSAEMARALEVAARLHASQTRKSTAIPYLSHLLGTCAIAIEYGATQEEAIGALLHDVIEDVEPVDIARAAVRSFGTAVEQIVEGCSDAVAGEKPPWVTRKSDYIAELAHETNPSILLVSASDKLHNARTIVADGHRSGADVWCRFNADRDCVLWYYESLVLVFESNGHSHKALTAELSRTVAEMRRLPFGADCPEAQVSGCPEPRVVMP